MAAAAVPALMKYGAPITGSILGGVIGKRLSGPSAGQKTAMADTQGTAGVLGGAAPQLLGAGRSLTNKGTDYASTSANYYQKLLGSRAGLREATAPDTASVLDYYKGAEGKVSSNLRGGSRDTALAELDREKTGKLAMIPAMARGEAAKNLVGAAAPILNAGTETTGQGVYAGQAATGASNSLYNQASDQQDRQSKAGSNYGSMIFDLLSGWKNKLGTGSGGSTWTPQSEVG